MGGEEAIDSTSESDNDGHLDSWEEGPAFGVGEDKDRILRSQLKSGFPS